MTLLHEDLTKQIIGAAIEVHRHLGPGLLESAYQACLVHELRLRGLATSTEVQWRSSTREFTSTWASAWTSWLRTR